MNERQESTYQFDKLVEQQCPKPIPFGAFGRTRERNDLKKITSFEKRDNSYNASGAVFNDRSLMALHLSP
jgi:hypothetical protein